MVNILIRWLIFLHVPLLVALSVTGACLKNMLVHMQAGINSQIQWIICSAIAIILLSIAALTLIMKEEEEDRSYINPVRRILVLISAIILLIPLMKFITGVLLFLSAVAVILLIPVVIGISSWIRYRFKEISH